MFIIPNVIRALLFLCKGTQKNIYVQDMSQKIAIHVRKHKWRLEGIYNSAPS